MIDQCASYMGGPFTTYTDVGFSSNRAPRFLGENRNLSKVFQGKLSVTHPHLGGLKTCTILGVGS